MLIFLVFPSLMRAVKHCANPNVNPNAYSEEGSGVKSNKATKKSSKIKEKKKEKAPPPPVKEKKKKKDKQAQQVEEPPARELESLMCFDEPAAANKSDQVAKQG